MTKARAAIYTRLSQDRDGTKESTARQEADCRDRAAREGWDVVQVFQDDDRSAYSGKPRRAFKRMMGSLDQFDVVIYWKTDRLVRRWFDIADVMKACNESGTQLVSIMDPIDTTGPFGQAMAVFLAAQAETESLNTSTRVKRMHEANAKAGKPHGGRRSYGFEKDGVTVIPEEAAMHHEARDRTFRGESLRSICNDWNARGIKPTSAKQWSVNTLKGMLLRPRTAGLRQYRGEIIREAQWEAIISPEDQQRLRAVLEGRSWSGKNRGRPPGHLMSGFYRCGRCGHTLRSSGAKVGRVWKCLKNPDDPADRCGRLSIKAEIVDPHVEALIIKRLATIKPNSASANRYSDNALALDKLEAKIIELGMDYDSGEISRKEWQTRRAPLEDRLKAAKAAMEQDAQSDVLGRFIGAGSVRELWDAMTLEEQRTATAALLESVTVAPGTQGAKTVDPKRLTVSWRRAAAR